MLRNFFIVSFRSILKNRLHSILTVLGLSAGLTAFLLIGVYVDHEESYDQFHENKDRIFRLQQDRYNLGNLTSESVKVCAAAGFTMKDNYPSIEHIVNLLYSPAVVTSEDRSFNESHFYFASADFFRVFSVPLLQGVDSLVLSRPGTVILSRQTARKYFGEEDPIGKVLDLRGVFNLEVTGIFEDLPTNSHMEIDMMASLETFIQYASDRATTSWKWDGYYTYIMLRDPADLRVIEENLPVLIERETGDWLKETGQDMKLNLQPLTSIYLYSSFKDEMNANGDHNNVYYLTLIAWFILVMAYINYVNVATVKSLERAREVGIRKVLGGYRLQLAAQFLSESLLLNLCAFILSVALVYLFIPAFADLSGRDLQTESIGSLQFWVSAVSLLIGGVVLSGFYPALVLSGFKPTEVLKGNLQGSSHGNVLRKGLVILQFVTAITLIICTFVVYQQVQFLRTQSLGFTIDEVLVVQAPLKKDSLYASRLSSFKTAVSGLTNISVMTTMREPPGAQIIEYANTIRRMSAPAEEINQYQIIHVDEDFLDVFDLKLVAGRMYTRNDPGDHSVMVINERALEVLGFKTPEDALREKIIWYIDTVEVIGVIQNYHHETLKYPVSPILFPFDPPYGLYLPIRLQGANPATTMAELEILYQQHFPGNPFNAYFLNDRYEQQYKSDIRFGKVVGIFSTISIIITCLGLFGLSSYTVLLRTKEIGIRKVLGASGSGIVQLLCRDYTILIGVAMLVSVPLAWYVMNEWLNNFANKMQLSWWVFVVPNLLVILITWLTIGGHMLRAASMNPVDVIRYE